jgi:hypothetical protein
MVLCAYNPSIEEAKAGGSRVRGQHWLHNETLFQKNNKKEKKKKNLVNNSLQDKWS